MQPIIYKSLDANAPQLTIDAGTLKTVLKACLVTGYGSKAGAGWEIVWEDAVANKIAIRSKNPTSIKSVLLIDDSQDTYATVTAYNGWDSATNTGTGKFADGKFVKQWNMGFTPFYTVIASDKFFYLFIQAKDNIVVMSGFGDAISLRNDLSFSVLIAQSSSSYTQSEICYEKFMTNLGVADFPRLPYKKSVAASGLFGDLGSRSDKYNRNDIAIFSKLTAYVSINDVFTPVIQLYGMLLPHSEAKATSYVNNTDIISNQVPFNNDIYGFIQDYSVGRIWIHTDDWGA